jgi:chitinase
MMPKARLTIFLTLIGLLLPAMSFAKPDHLVVGYVPSRRDAYASPEDFDFDAFTHLCRAFLREQDDGSLAPDAGYFDPNFESLARSHGVKLLMSVGGASPIPDHWLNLADNPAHMRTFLDSLDQLLKEHQYDGIDIDWEPAPKNDAEGKSYVALLKAIHERFPGKMLTLALGVTKKSLAHIPMDQVIANVDLLNAMTYSYATVGSGIATFNENLHADPAAKTRYSVDDGIANLIETYHVPPEKVLLGINFWPDRFRASHLGDTFPRGDRSYEDNIPFPEVMDLLSTGKYTPHRDDVADAPYILRNTGNCLITYDDPISVKAKCDLARQTKCAGVMIWHLGADLGSGETPLLNAIDESFGMKPTPISTSALEHEIARLSKKPAPGNLTLDALLKLDQKLRTDQAAADDAKWITGSKSK